MLAQSWEAVAASNEVSRRRVAAPLQLYMVLQLRNFPNLGLCAQLRMHAYASRSNNKKRHMSHELGSSVGDQEFLSVQTCQPAQ